jgi:hypothetical protein
VRDMFGITDTLPRVVGSHSLLAIGTIRLREEIIENATPLSVRACLLRHLCFGRLRRRSTGRQHIFVKFD